jgi:glutamate racemase
LTAGHAPAAQAPIGVFDSGVGGLSVLRALQVQLPQERFVYVADNAHAPYGERDDGHLLQRSAAIADYLRGKHHIKALVVACNTATAAAIGSLREQHAPLPIVGIEPALKPAAAHSRTGRVGVMATRSTLNSEKFRKLHESLKGQADFVLQPCDGLADAIENADTDRMALLCEGYLHAMGPFGTQAGAMDTLVLGCTHYPFAAELLGSIAGPGVVQLDGGMPVARHTLRLLEQQGLLCTSAAAAAAEQGPTRYFSTGRTELLARAVQRWLERQESVQALQV